MEIALTSYLQVSGYHGFNQGNGLFYHKQPSFHTHIMNCNIGQYWTSGFRDMAKINWSGNWYFMASVLMVSRASPDLGIPDADSLFCDVTSSLTVFWMIRRLGQDNTADGGPLSATSTKY